MNETQMKKYLAATYAAQRKPSNNNCRCPRCGKPHGHGYNTGWSMSRHEHVYVCPSCYTEELVLKEPIPLDLWWVFRTLTSGGELPERYDPATRETPSMTAIELMFSDEDPDVIWATFENWFDVQAKFGITAKHFPRFEYINLYAFYNVFSGELTMYYTVVSDGEDDICFDYIPTLVEKLRIVANMEAECLDKNGCTMAALVQRHKTEDQPSVPGPFLLMECFERDIQTPICFASFEDAFRGMIGALAENLECEDETLIIKALLEEYPDCSFIPADMLPSAESEEESNSESCEETEDPEREDYEEDDEDELGYYFNDDFGVGVDGKSAWSNVHGNNTDWVICDAASIQMAEMSTEVDA